MTTTETYMNVSTATISVFPMRMEQEVVNGATVNTQPQYVLDPNTGSLVSLWTSTTASTINVSITNSSTVSVSAGTVNVATITSAIGTLNVLQTLQTITGGTVNFIGSAAAPNRLTPPPTLVLGSAGDEVVEKSCTLTSLTF